MISLFPMIPLAYFGIRLSIIDFKAHRLPNRLVGWFAVIEVFLLGFLSWDAEDLARLMTALGVGVASTTAYLLLYFLSRGALGMGDVKFAFPLGLCVGWYSANHWLVAIFVSLSRTGGSHRTSNQANDQKIKTCIWSLHVSWHLNGLWFCHFQPMKLVS